MQKRSDCPQCACRQHPKWCHVLHVSDKQEARRTSVSHLGLCVVVCEERLRKVAVLRTVDYHWSSVQCYGESAVFCQGEHVGGEKSFHGCLVLLRFVLHWEGTVSTSMLTFRSSRMHCFCLLVTNSHLGLFPDLVVR